MNATGSSRLRAFEAEVRARGRARAGYCRPVRMQGAGWGQEDTARAQVVWRRTFLRGAVWRRGLFAGGVVAMIGGMAGVQEWPLMGLAVALAAVLAQSWQSAEDRRYERRLRLN